MRVNRMVRPASTAPTARTGQRPRRAGSAEGGHPREQTVNGHDITHVRGEIGEAQERSLAVLLPPDSVREAVQEGQSLACLRSAAFGPQ